MWTVNWRNLHTHHTHTQRNRHHTHTHHTHVHTHIHIHTHTRIHVHKTLRETHTGSVRTLNHSEIAEEKVHILNSKLTHVERFLCRSTHIHLWICAETKKRPQCTHAKPQRIGAAFQSARELVGMPLMHREQWIRWVTGKIFQFGPA